jgi:mono/diheme cytochrome c family protein
VPKPDDEMMKKFAALCALGILASLATLPHPARASSTGLYTAEQAKAGKALYIKNCSACHAVDLSGAAGPPLRGTDAPYHGTQSVAQVFDYISVQMPMNNPGALPKATYVSIMAYLLKKNGHEPGTKPLTADGAEKNVDTMI